MKQIRIPRRFFDDHSERELPTPVIVRQTARHVWIHAEDSALPELLNDAQYYADKFGPECYGEPHIKPAARALLKALLKR